MEESAKRKERLQAMRLEASCTAASQPPYYSPPPVVVPPPSLLQPQLVDPPVLDSPPPTRRFDFYTDPTSAFSSSKRMRGVVTRAFSPSSPYGPPPPPPPSFPTVQQFRLAQPPNSSDYGVRSRVPQNSPWRSPITPLPGYRGSPLPGYRGSPASGSSSWIRSGDSTGYQYPAHSNSVLRSPHFDPRGSPISNTRNSSPHLSFGRGRARQFSGGRSPRPSGGRGQNYKNKASAQDDIENYFSQSMLEDPWRDLQPVVGNILEPMAGPEYWLPESMPGKQHKLSEKESSGRFTSKSSLAEFLAASFEEAINDDD